MHVIDMSSAEQQLDGFRQALLGDTRLQNQLRAAQSASDVVAVAAGAGFALDLRQIEGLPMSAPAELSETELETVAAALPCWCDPSVVDSKSCG